MQCTCIFILLITLTYIQTIFSLDTIDTNPPECLSKNHLSKIINRDRRASISRPYFRHWRQTRDNSRYSAKNSLAFSPRLGKRSHENENENELNNVDNKFVYRSVVLDSFLVTFADYLQEKQINIVYEDSTKICLSQPITDALIQQVLDRVGTSRRRQDEQDTEDTRERQTIGKHPVLFRYRLG